MPETTKKQRTSRPKVEVVPDHGEEPAEQPPHAHDSPAVCPVAWCPICMAVTAVEPLRPDVIEHLLKAGTELLMAFRAVIDVRADDLAGEASDSGGAGKARLEKIELG